MTRLYCTDCGENVLSLFIPAKRHGWFDSYFCSICENGIARESKGRFVIWTGGSYANRTKPDNIELGKSAEITGVEL